MAWTTQALPVVTIPEQGHVTFVRDDVVNIRRRDHLAYLLAASAQRMLVQPTCPSLLPHVVVVALGAALSRLGPGRTLEQVCVIITVPRVTGQRVAALGIARLLRSQRHGVPSM